MKHDPWLERLSHHLDGEATAAERDELERHLAQCDECRSALADLRRLVVAARELAPTPPARDLWPEIAGRLEALPETPTASRSAWRDRLVLSWPQALAAAAAVALVSAAGAWWWQGSDSPRTAQEAGPPVAATESLTSASEAAYLALSGEIDDLRRRLEDEGERLDPETVRVLDKNLRLIEEAIGESRAALTSDPTQAAESESFAASYSGKLELLRQATDVALAQAEGS